MKFSKRLLSFFLAVLMLVSTFSGTVFAESNDLNTQDTNTEGSVTATELKGKVEGNKEVFTFELPERQAQRRVRRAAPLNQGNDTIVNLTAVGLNGGVFDWSALPNSEFKLTAKWKTADGQEHSKVFATINAAGETQYYVGWPVDGTLAKTASIEADFDQNIKIRVTYNSGNGTGVPGGLLFNITITELAEPRANVEYVDPYGRELTDSADLPTGTMPKVTADGLTDVEIDLPESSGEINMRDSELIDEDELNAAENGLTYKVDNKSTGETVTIDNKEYKLDISAPNAKQIGTIKMIYQKDVIVPPTDNNGDPVTPADGYVRLTFDANENKADGITGTHNNGLYAGKQKSYIDVKKGVNYDNANLQDAIKELSTTGKKLVNGKTEDVAQDAKKPWTPKVPTDTTAVTTATYNAQYTKSVAEQVTELGGLDPVTIKVWKGDTVDWNKGVAPKTTDTNDAAVVNSLLANATVTENTIPARTSAEAGKKEGTLLVTFGDGSTLTVDHQWLYVWEHIVKVDPNNTDPDAPKEEDLPKDKIEVRFIASTGVESITTTGKTYAKEGTVFQDKDFPQEKDITFNDGYKGPVTWTPTDRTVTQKSPAFLKRQGYFRFTASATKLKDIIGPVDPGVTPNPDKKLYWTVTFVSADTATGTVAKENTVYVLKTANKTLADVTAPTTTPATGYKFDKWTPALDNKTAVDKDLTVTGTFTKLTDVIGPVDPGVTPNPDTKLYWTVTFVSADTATGTVAKENTVYVLKTANKTLADVTAPKTTPATGYKFDKWTPALDNKTAVDKDLTVTGTFTKLTDVIGPVDPGVTPNPDTKLYWTVTFVSADTATGTVAKENTVYVLKTANKTLADVTAPTTTPATGYKFDKWTPALDNKTAVDKDLTVTGTFTKLTDVIGPVDPGVTPNPDTKLYWTVTFVSADTATGTVAKENTVYVLKTANKTLADVTAPTTTPATGYKFDKWTPALDNKTAVDKDITVTGTFTKDIIGPVDPGVTPNPDTKLYWTVTFVSADEKTGTVDANNTYYVLKTAKKTLADVTAPKTTPATGYAFEKWTPALDNKTAIDKDITVTGTFTKDIIGPVDPGVTPNPDTKLYWTVTFVSADTATGTVAKENTVYVLKTAKKTLADVTAPKTTPATGYKFDKWTPALDNKTAVDKDLTVTGTFTKLTDVIGPVDPGVTPNPD
ncbi:InlB B-repeat-containing protein, partial [Fenollaria timonensis]|uniref:InlB B-repeat-containing protein n=1 Tax=Fenollaria timonensis TaxID=1723384 RepID=UPI000B105DBF